MILDPQLVGRLRSSFLSGATPSRLVRHIADRHAGDPNWPRYVQGYFWEAFSVVMLALENKPPDVEFREEDFSYLNADVLHDIVRRLPTWRRAVVQPLPGHRAWCDGLEMAPDELQMVEKVRPESHPSLSQSWSSMNSRARQFVRQSIVNSQVSYERAQVLIRLVERLQQQVVDLEQRLEGTGQGRDHRP